MSSLPVFHLCDLMVIQNLLEIAYGELEQIR